jgi:hypothetical protein
MVLADVQPFLQPFPCGAIAAIQYFSRKTLDLPNVGTVMT